MTGLDVLFFSFVFDSDTRFEAGWNQVFLRFSLAISVTLSLSAFYLKWSVVSTKLQLCLSRHEQRHGVTSYHFFFVYGASD